MYKILTDWNKQNSKLWNSKKVFIFYKFLKTFIFNILPIFNIFNVYIYKNFKPMYRTMFLDLYESLES